MELKLRALPVGFRFRPTDCEISKYFLTRKVFEQPMKARNVPEECHNIFSRHPRDLPGYPREKHWYFYSRKLTHQVTTNSHNIWRQIGEETDVLDGNNNDALVGIKRSLTLVDHEGESDDTSLSSDEEESPKYNWFMDEISLPLTVSDTDWVFCHVFRKKIKPQILDVLIIESESEEEDEDVEEEEEEIVISETLDLFPSPSPP